MKINGRKPTKMITNDPNSKSPYYAQSMEYKT